MAESRERLFDRGEEYEEMLNRGLRLSGETPDYFMRGRVADLVRRLPPVARPTRILDFGCGIGDTTAHLGRAFSGAKVTGVDTAESALECAIERHASDLVEFSPLTEYRPDGTYDLAYANGVVHHIPLEQRDAAMRTVLDSLRPGGLFALFENNPWNPGTRMVMRRIPFDRDAITLSPPTARRLLRRSGFETPYPARHLFFFPRSLRWLRALEPGLRRFPLGAQYWVLARKPSA
jgi:SAM-dependent methyltransferase